MVRYLVQKKFSYSLREVDINESLSPINIRKYLEKAQSKENSEEALPEFDVSIFGEEEKTLNALEKTIIEGKLPALGEFSLRLATPSVRINSRNLLHQESIVTVTESSNHSPSNYFRQDSDISTITAKNRQ